MAKKNQRQPIPLRCGECGTSTVAKRTVGCEHGMVAMGVCPKCKSTVVTVVGDPEFVDLFTDADSGVLSQVFGEAVSWERGRFPPAS